MYNCMFVCMHMCALACLFSWICAGCPTFDDALVPAMEEVYPVAKEVSSISWLKSGLGASFRGASRLSSTSLPLSVSLKTAVMLRRQGRCTITRQRRRMS
jgi:hypothetical protein